MHCSPSHDVRGTDLLYVRSVAVGAAEAEQWSRAEPEIRRALAADPAWGEGWLYLARTLVALGELPEASRAAIEGARLGALRSTAWLEAASIADGAGDREDALDALRNAVAGRTHRPWLVAPRRDPRQAMTGDGILDLEALLETDEARELLREAASEDPALDPELVRLDRRLGAGDPKGAALLERYSAIVESRNHAELFYRLGLHQLEAGDPGAAWRTLARARAAGFPGPIVDGWSALASERLGLDERALGELGRNLAAHDAPGWALYPGEFPRLRRKAE